MRDNLMRRNTTLYAKSARFDGEGHILTEEDFRREAPSVFAVEAHESRSERFKPIPTWEIIQGLIRAGFMPVGVKQAVSRDPGRADFTKHLIRLRRIDEGKKYSYGDTVCEMLLKNANDGTSAYQLMAGLFRVVCMNSLVTCDSQLDEIRVRHSGDVMGEVIEGSYRVLEHAQAALAAPADWGRITLKHTLKAALAEGAHILRFGDELNERGDPVTPITPAQLLQTRRADDEANDLWTTFNVVQENCMRGGLTARHPTYREGNRLHRGRRVTTRPINGIDQDVKLNRALWVLGQRIAAELAPRAAA